MGYYTNYDLTVENATPDEEDKIKTMLDELGVIGYALGPDFYSYDSVKWYDYAEDMFIDDDVLVIMNTKGTKSLKDDVIRDYMYWRPDLESKSGYMDVVKNGSCINK